MEELHDFPANSAPGSRIGTSKSSQSAYAHGEEPIHVVVRIRPPMKREMEPQGDEGISVMDDKRSIQIHENKSKYIVRYDRIYDQFTSQNDVFLGGGILELVDRAMEGFSATIFAFGQTGSGKTYTMIGPETVTSESQGVIPRALNRVFQVISQNPAAKFKLQASFLEIYNEQIYDLLSPSGAILPLRWRKHQGFYAENAIRADCSALEKSMDVLREGVKNRTVKAHALNDRSSRSHSILMLYINSEVQQAENGQPGEKFGKISFVDLAGSERVKHSKTQGEALTEALNINKSLLALGNCISTLADPKHKHGHIPYRDSKLTKLLMDSLGGNGLALMIACISLSKFAIAETMQTLRYASRAKRIKNKPAVRKNWEHANIEKLRNEIVLLRNENSQLKSQFSRSMSAAFAPSPGFSNEEKENMTKMLQSYAMELDSLKYENMQLAESKQRTEHMYANLMRKASIRGEEEANVPTLPALPASKIPKAVAKKTKVKKAASKPDVVPLPALPGTAPQQKPLNVPDLNSLREEMNRLDSEIARYKRN